MYPIYSDEKVIIKEIMENKGIHRCFDKANIDLPVGRKINRIKSINAKIEAISPDDAQVSPNRNMKRSSPHKKIVLKGKNPTQNKTPHIFNNLEEIFLPELIDWLIVWKNTESIEAEKSSTGVINTLKAKEYCPKISSPKKGRIRNIGSSFEKALTKLEGKTNNGCSEFSLAISVNLPELCFKNWKCFLTLIDKKPNLPAK